MASFQSNFLKGQRIGRRTAAQEENMRAKKEKAARKRAHASAERKEKAKILELRARIESEKTKRAELKLFKGV